jgi:hypothetical protein
MKKEKKEEKPGIAVVAGCGWELRRNDSGLYKYNVVWPPTQARAVALEEKSDEYGSASSQEPLPRRIIVEKHRLFDGARSLLQRWAYLLG